MVRAQKPMSAPMMPPMLVPVVTSPPRREPTTTSARVAESNTMPQMGHPVNAYSAPNWTCAEPKDNFSDMRSTSQHPSAPGQQMGYLSSCPQNMMMMPVFFPQAAGGQPTGGQPTGWVAHVPSDQTASYTFGACSQEQEFSSCGPSTNNYQAMSSDPPPRNAATSRRRNRQQPHPDQGAVKQKAGNAKGGRGVKNAPGSDRDDPVSLTTNPDACKWAMSRLEHAVPSEQYAIISWLHPATLQLALSEHGCRVVQKVFDVAGGEARAALSDQLRGHVLELLYSPHGNHVLQKFVEVMPSCAMQFVLDELEVYKGGWATLAKHKFGCRIEQRILEHCPEHMTSGLVEAIVQNAGTLFTHKFGNYVIQSVLEHAVDAQRCRVVDALIQEGVSVLAQDRVASNVLERALHHCNPEFQQKIVSSLTQVPGALYEAASDRYGVFVVRQMLSVVEGSLRDEVFEQLQGLPELTQYEIPMTADEFGQMKELPDMSEYEIPKTMDYFPDDLMPVYEIPNTMERFPDMMLGA